MYGCSPPDCRSSVRMPTCGMTTTQAVTAVRDGAETFSVSLNLTDTGFSVSYDDSVDTPYPGAAADHGPKATRLLAASVTLCLAESLLHCLRKGRVPITRFEASAVVTVERNDKGRLRVTRILVLLDPEIGGEYTARLERCGELFEDYCTVTESVRHGIDVRVTVAAT